MAGPEAMRRAMADYVRTVHEAYRARAAGLPPAVRARMPLFAGPFTVAAAGVQSLHVIATREALPEPVGPEVALDDALGELRWTLRFFDPVVLPPLGLVDETRGPAGAEVRRTLGISTHLYHLVVNPGAELGPHHAGHAGTGLANAHAAAAQDYETLRRLAPAGLVDELEGAWVAGLPVAHALVASALAPDDPALAELAREPRPDPTTVRRTLLGALRERA
ncbi:MAG TPA: hypothetical protein ENK55_04255 [Actinobacteria bacterium]|nr:hypothetical protein [Actinomycetota bacterium]